MTPAIADQLLDLMVRRLDNVADAAAMVDWATDALVAGDDSPALIILAGLPRSTSVFEAQRWLDQALDELEVVVPEEPDLRRRWVAAISRALLTGRMPVSEGLDVVHRHAVSPLEHPADLMAWCHLGDARSPDDYRALSAADVEARVRQLATQWAVLRPFGGIASDDA